MVIFFHLFQASTVISPWAPGYNVVGEKLKRNNQVGWGGGRAYYAHHITTVPSGFLDLPTALLGIVQNNDD